MLVGDSVALAPALAGAGREHAHLVWGVGRGVSDQYGGRGGGVGGGVTEPGAVSALTHVRL